MNCPACGHSNREGASFCDECGAALKRTCPSCAAEVRPAAKFCDSCGASLQAKPAEVETPAHLARKILEERGRIEGERRTVTALFADAKGFTPLSERLGEEKIYEFVQRCVEVMVAGVHRHEGTVTQFTGDGIVALFGAPIAHEDSARRAVAAALDIQRSLGEYIDGAGVDTAFRIGLNTGPVVVGRITDDLNMDYTAVGDTVNLAARMEQMCEPRCVYITENTHRLVGDYFECEEVGHLEVKGKSAPVHVYKAIAERHVRTRLDAAIARGLSPFTGRDRELDILKGFWDDALAGRGQIVLVSGEPGIGKSRLLLEFRRWLADDVIWREAQCVPYGEGIPYLPVVGLVKSGFAIAETDDEGSIIDKVDTDTAEWTPAGQKTVPYLKFLLQVDPGDAAVETMDPMERRAGILDALRALILERSRIAPRVVVVEDLHWADDASEEAFRVCADVVATSRVLMILTFRPGYMHPSADLPNAHRIVLGDLDDDARRALASATLRAAELPADLAGPVTHKAEGNPLFIEEVAKALADGVADTSDVPDSLQDVILARIDRLEAEAREALQLASVIGREFTLRLLNRISDLHSALEGVLTELKTLELIYEKAFFPELAYMFKHALTHDVAYSTLLVERRKTLHRVVASAIEELYADRLAEHYETLAHHYTRSEEWEKALEYLERSGDKAVGTFANEDALRYYGSALEIADDRMASSDGAARIGSKRGFVAMRLGRFDEAIADFDRLGRWAHASGDAFTEGLSWGYRSMAKFWAHDLEGSDEAAQRALTTGADHPDLRFFGLAFRSFFLLFTNRFAEFRTVWDQLLGLEDQVDHPTLRGMWGWERPMISIWDGDYADAIEASAKWRNARETSGDVASVLWGRWSEALARMASGEYERALAILLDVVLEGDRVGERLVYTRALNTIGWIYVELQDLERAVEWNRRSFDEAVASGFPDPEIEANAALNLGDAYLAAGRLDEAAEQYAWVERIYRNPRPEDRFALFRYSQHMLASFGTLWLERGDTVKARRYADECLELAEASGAKKNVVKAKRLRGEIARREGRLEDAEREVAEALALARAIGNPGQLWKTWDALGGVRAAMGKSDEAAAAWREAVAVIDRVASSLQDANLRETFLASRHVSEIRAKV